MKVFYRVSPGLSSHPNPLGSDKYTIIKKCLYTFIDATDNDTEITFICDSMPEPWINELDEFGNIQIASHGNVETFHTQLDMASKLEDDENVLICEDDYVWRPNTLKDLAISLDVLDFVSPYDHPSHYLEERFDKHYETILISGITYRRAPSNTLTFACKAKKIKDNLSHMKAHGINDHEMWQGLNIYNPCYSMATHMVEGLLAPNVNWHDIIKRS